MPTVIQPNKVFSNVKCAEYIKDFTFDCGHQVPIYHVHTMHALTQIIGYIKYKNADYGQVLYRGQCKLHGTLEPSIYHSTSRCSERERRNRHVNTIMQRALADNKFCKYAHIQEDTNSQIRLASVLQHYGIPTQYLDVVDNHWTALWFGLNEWREHIDGSVFCRYERRRINYLDVIENRFSRSDNDYDKYAESLYQYILLIAISKPTIYQGNGILIGDDTIAVDLRSNLPSVFLRPHSQHGWTIRNKTSDGIFGLDMAPNVVGIIRMRIDDVDKWLGNGELLSQNGLFPNPEDDLGYGVLLNHSDFFEGTPFQIPYYT